MNNVGILVIIIIIIEFILAFLFSLIAQIWYKKEGIDLKAVLKGVLERIFLAIALINNQTNALTFFSALKLATRLNIRNRKTSIMDLMTTIL